MECPRQWEQFRQTDEELESDLEAWDEPSPQRQKESQSETSSMGNWGILYCQKCNSRPCPCKEHALLKLLKIKTGVIY